MRSKFRCDLVTETVWLNLTGVLFIYFADWSAWSASVTSHQQAPLTWYGILVPVPDENRVLLQDGCKQPRKSNSGRRRLPHWSDRSHQSLRWKPQDKLYYAHTWVCLIISLIVCAYLHCDIAFSHRYFSGPIDPSDLSPEINVCWLYMTKVSIVIVITFNFCYRQTQPFTE